MTAPKSGEYDTYWVKSFQTVLRPDGKMGLLIETQEGRPMVLGLDRRMIDFLIRELAKLSAAPTPPNKPNA